ncbi:hypothetical protein OB2597_03382 [Pseudooceanicola batsensis HTCC2597]|uniref:DUF1330 domain-containing protein n=1 Tax=Pseudooceanicola batsensis (strain ATCC BAA-863 / DSM 15984 / KCTC 12145 / HTCC2597) TaxID=252305 RepID=A3TXS0_PSEBH|nr:hypothetical protein [Pseudooceanicola batsensis]EAQ03630.1 hypothetical protein OB2597_03382 [Pseudooceanicola batsensis HTCC2597]
MSQDIIERLVETHGEDGAVPSRGDWATILDMPGNEPIFILNLLAFEPQTGQASFGQYLHGVAPAIAAAGGEQVFFGPAGLSYGTGGDTRWDAAMLMKYPSPQALANMWLDPDFIEAHQSRGDGLAKSLVLVIPAEQARI